MIREDCKELRITLQEATRVAQDRTVWKATIDKRLKFVVAYSCLLCLEGLGPT